MEPQPSKSVEVFCSYSHRDEDLRKELDKHVKILERRGVVNVWHDRRIGAGDEWKREIDEHLESADVILLLVSPDFIASDYCYDVETKRAVERHDAGEACVIPVFLRPVNWKGAPFGKIQGLPTDAKPVTSWTNHDEAFVIVSEGIERAVETLIAPRRTQAAAAKSASPLHIPRPPAVGFVARHDAEGRDLLERLRRELAPHNRRVVALWGGGGVGKTTLAAEAARALEADFGGRVVWTGPLQRADFTLPTLLDEIATQLGRPDLRTLPPDQREEQVRALIADAPPLVVLDNFETIKLEEQTACAEWLAQRATCPALVTTRERINDANNLISNVQIASMSPPEAHEFLTRLVAQAQDAGVFTEPVREEIIRRSEAIPFVIQWVVAQIDLADSPQAVFEDLERGEGDAVERVFNRSFNLPQLGDDGRDTLLALSLFVPDASPEALAAVAGFGEDLPRLRAAVRRLSALKLLRAKDDETRRLLLDGLTRRLAKAHLSRDPRAHDFRRRFITHFLTYAQAHRQRTAEAYNLLEAEKDNLLAAMDTAFSLNDWKRVRDFAYILAVGGMLNVRGYWDEALRRNEQALKAARNAADESGVAAFTHNTALMYQDRGQLEEVQRLYEESLEIERRLGNQSGIAKSLHQLGRLAQDKEELDEARRLYKESLEIERRLGDQGGIARSLGQLAILTPMQGDVDEARRLNEEALKIFRKLGDQGSIAKALHEFGTLAQTQGDVDAARRLYKESLEIKGRLGDKNGMAVS
ncbi:MAG TPA: toll/interleukin-1 receptor domain-containing protein, partial [Pyrinomonadaceae bacterium]|nr:toll/interleukin-1 receptor domain-containing protein [Pyrinomonadaceae bacterium]